MLSREPGFRFPRRADTVEKGPPDPLRERAG